MTRFPESPVPIPALDVVDSEPQDDTPSSFWLLTVTAGSTLIFYASIRVFGALLIGVTA